MGHVRLALWDLRHLRSVFVVRSLQASSSGHSFRTFSRFVDNNGGATIFRDLGQDFVSSMGLCTIILLAYRHLYRRVDWLLFLFRYASSLLYALLVAGLQVFRGVHYTTYMSLRVVVSVGSLYRYIGRVAGGLAISANLFFWSYSRAWYSLVGEWSVRYHVRGRIRLRRVLVAWNFSGFSSLVLSRVAAGCSSYCSLFFVRL